MDVIYVHVWMDTLKTVIVSKVSSGVVDCAVRVSTDQAFGIFKTVTVQLTKSVVMLILYWS